MLIEAIKKRLVQPPERSAPYNFNDLEENLPMTGQWNQVLQSIPRQKIEDQNIIVLKFKLSKACFLFINACKAHYWNNCLTPFPYQLGLLCHLYGYHF